MIALGWTWSGCSLPVGVTAYPFGFTCLLAVPVAQAQDGRTRMRWQVRLFESGLDLLPLAPQRAVYLQQARDFPTTTIAQALRAISGKAQFTVMLDMIAKAPKPPPTEGRGWLAARKAAYDARDVQMDSLKALARCLNADSSVMQPVQGGMRSDFLVQRADLDGFQDRLSTACDAIGFAKQAKLTVTGPWPPYAFASLPELAKA